MISYFCPRELRAGVINGPQELVQCLELMPEVCFRFLI